MDVCYEEMDFLRASTQTHLKVQTVTGPRKLHTKSGQYFNSQNPYPLGDQQICKEGNENEYQKGGNRKFSQEISNRLVLCVVEMRYVGNFLSALQARSFACIMELQES